MNTPSRIVRQKIDNLAYVTPETKEVFITQLREALRTAPELFLNSLRGIKVGSKNSNLEAAITLLLAPAPDANDVDALATEVTAINKATPDDSSQHLASALLSILGVFDDMMSMSGAGGGGNAGIQSSEDFAAGFAKAMTKSNEQVHSDLKRIFCTNFVEALPLYHLDGVTRAVAIPPYEGQTVYTRILVARIVALLHESTPEGAGLTAHGMPPYLCAVWTSLKKKSPIMIKLCNAIHIHQRELTMLLPEFKNRDTIMFDSFWDVMCHIILIAAMSANVADEHICKPTPSYTYIEFYLQLRLKSFEELADVRKKDMATIHTNLSPLNDAGLRLIDTEIPGVTSNSVRDYLARTGGNTTAVSGAQDFLHSKAPREDTGARDCIAKLPTYSYDNQNSNCCFYCGWPYSHPGMHKRPQKGATFAERESACTNHGAALMKKFALPNGFSPAYPADHVILYRKKGH